MILLNRSILVLNVFLGKARRYSHDCSWDLPGSGVDRNLCWVYVLDTFIVTCSLFLWCFDKLLLRGGGGGGDLE